MCLLFELISKASEVCFWVPAAMIVICNCPR